MNGTAPPRQLRRLLEANRRAVEHLELPPALRQILDAAVELAGAAYGAIGVLGPDGRLDQLLHTGLDERTLASITDLSEGRDPRPPPIPSFLAVPLQVRDEVFGHLYLADPRVGAFSAEDRVLVEALAGTAGVAIAHARMFEESTRRERWTAATTEITHELLTNDDVDAVQLVADRMRELAVAQQVAVVLTHGTSDPVADLVVDRTSGDAAVDLVGAVLGPGDNLVRRCLRSRRPQLAVSLSAMPSEGSTGTAPPGGTGPAMVVPLADQDGVKGVVLVLRSPGARQFAEFDLDVAASLAGHAALALDRADARAAKAVVGLRQERDRIARDLHDHAIQRLYAVGLTLHGLEVSLGAGAVADRLEAQVEEIDATIRQIRTTIFALQDPGGGQEGLRSVVLAVVLGASTVLREAPEVVFRGPVDLLVPPSMYADVSAVVREALSNVARHAEASRVSLVVTATPTDLRIVVEDDGRGPDPSRDHTLSGLENLRRRAVARRGSCELAPREPRGSRLSWHVLLEDLDAG